MKPTTFNYQDYLDMRKKYLEAEADATELTGQLVTVAAENERLKAQIKAMTDDIRENPICVKCRFWDNDSNDYSEECKKCKKCGWYPWNDEEAVPCIWEWRGMKDE